MNHFIVFDFETDGTNPEICEPVQVAAIAINPYNLSIIESSSFCSDMKPQGIDSANYLTNNVSETVKWHAKHQGTSPEEVVQRWKNAPPAENVWKNFVQYVNKYNPKKSQWTAPVSAGMNIRNFDLPIVNRLNEKYNVKKLFNYEAVDLRDLFFYSLIWDHDVRSRSMDNMRPYFGMSSEGAHDALVDVKDSAKLIIRYLQFFKNTFNRNPNPYKNSMKPKVLSV